MRQEVSFGKLKLTNNKGASNNVTQVGPSAPPASASEIYPPTHTHTSLCCWSLLFPPLPHIAKDNLELLLLLLRSAEITGLMHVVLDTAAD